MSNNGFVHTHVLLNPVARRFEAIGATVVFECPVQVGLRRGYIDMVARLGERQFLFEAETTPLRVDWDITKAFAFGGRWLGILVPTVRVARLCKRVVARRRAENDLENISIQILSPGAFSQWFSQYFPSFSTANRSASASKSNPKNTNQTLQ